MNYWERWIGDWKRKTAHLSAEAKGIYGELLDHQYATHKALPLDHEDIYRLAGARTASEIKATEKVIAEFYMKTAEGYTNKRAEEEIAKRLSYIEGQRGRANRRWHAEETPKKPRGNGSHKLIEDTGEVVERIPLNTGEEFEVRQSYVDELKRLYPSVDVPQTLREARGWCLAKPERCKTQRGIRTFINGWMTREQNRG